MHLAFWNRMSWWQRTRMATIMIVACATVVVLMITVLVATLAGSATLTSVSWLALTAFPMIAVALIASHARIQQHINIRSPQAIEMPALETSKS